MGGSYPTDGPDDYWGGWLSLHDDRPRRIRVVPDRLLPQVPPAVDKMHEAARLEPDRARRPVYWAGIDWREEFGPKGCHAKFPGALTPLDQGNTDSCAGFAVVHALRANLAITRGVDVPDLNPYFVWGLARERVEKLWAGAGNLLREALSVVNTYGTPTGRKPTYDEVNAGSFIRSFEKYALEFTKGPQAASINKIQSIVDLGSWLGDASAWLHAHGPVVVHMTVDRAEWSKVTPQHPVLNYRKGLAFDTELTKAYGGHDVVVVGYMPVGSGEHSDSFVIMNSYGPSWGDRGFAYIKVPEARQSFRQAYGLLFREHLGYNWAGRSSAAQASRFGTTP